MLEVFHNWTFMLKIYIFLVNLIDLKHNNAFLIIALLTTVELIIQNESHNNNNSMPMGQNYCKTSYKHLSPYIIVVYLHYKFFELSCAFRWLYRL